MAKTEIIYRATLDSSGVVKGVNLAKQNLDSLGASAENTAKKLGSTSNSAGVAGATLAEVGRLVSDLPYGFSAVANNASQLVSMFGMLTISAGGLGKGLKELGKAFLGPVGIVVAVQAAIAYYEEFVASSNKAKDATNSLTTELEAQSLALSSILKTFTIEQYDDTLKLLVNTSTEFKNAFDKLDETQKNNKDTVFNLMRQYKELLDIRRQIKDFETQSQRKDLTEEKIDEYLGKINALRLKEIDLLKIFRDTLFK